MNTTTIIPAAQLAPARALALDYGHEWACALAAADAEGRALPAMTPEAISAWVVSNRHPGSLAGIDCPAFDEYGNIAHTTGTGRLEWYTMRDGVTQLYINRPGASQVLAASTVPTGHPHASDGSVSAWRDEADYPNPAHCYYQRHVDALVGALTALVGAQRAIEATDHLRPGAVDHQLTPEQARLVEEVLTLARQIQAHGLGGYIEALERAVWRIRSVHDYTEALRAAAEAAVEEAAADPFTPRPVGPEVSRDE